MATRGNTKDVKITLSVESLGDEGIETLRRSIEALAKEGGDAGPEFQRLADEIGRLGDQADALQGFTELISEVDRLQIAEREAAAASQALQAELAQAQVATRAYAAAKREAVAAENANKEAQREAAAGIRNLNAEYDVASRSTTGYRDALKVLTDVQGQSKVAEVTLAQARRDATADLSRAEAAERKLETAYVASYRAAQQAERGLASIQAELVASATAAEALGVSTQDAASTTVQLVAALNSTGAAAQRLKTEVDELRESDRLLAIEQRALADLQQRTLEAIRGEAGAWNDAQQNAREYAAAIEAAAQREREWLAGADQIVQTVENTARLTRETEKLVAVNAELSRQAAFEKQAEDARKLLQAAEYVQVWERELQKAEIQARATADAALDSASRIEGAFNTLGVRSVEQLRNEILAVRSAMAVAANQAQLTGQSMSGAFAAGEAKIQSLERQIRELNGTLTLGDKASKLFANSLGQIAAGNLVADGVGYLINKVKEMGREFIVAIVQIDQLRRGLNAIYKDSGTAARQIEFLRRASGEAGVSVGGLSKEFVKFSAAMQSAGVPIGESNDLFKSLVESSASLGLSAEETAGSLNALGQMASKGSVSMEELRQQLGDRLPGAFGLVANGLGITQAQLVKLVESGNLAARDLFPALSQALKTMKGETDGLVPNWERLTGAMTEAAQASGDAAWTRVLAAGLKLLTATVGIVGGAFLGLSNAIGLAGSAAAIFFGPGLGTWKERMALMREEIDKAAERQASFSDAIDRAIDPTKAAAAAAQQAAAANQQLGQSTQQVLTANAGLERSAQLTAVALNLAGNNALTASAKYVQLNLAGVELLKQQEQETLALEKSAKATKTRGDSLVDLAKLQGQESVSLQAAGVAADEYSAATQRVAASKREELLITEQLLKGLLDDQKARGLTAEQIKVQKDELDKKVQAGRAEVEQSNEAAAAAEREAAARKLAIQTYADNTARVDEYRSAVEAASRVVIEYERLASQGKKTDEEVMRVKQRLTEAQVLYKDALNDSVASIQREASAKAANLQLESANYSVRLQSATIMAQAARAIGDNATALYYELEAKRANIEITKIRYQLMKLEAEAEIQSLNIKKLEIPVGDALREQKLKEIDIRIQLQKVKLLEAGAGDEVVRALEREITAMRNNSNQRDSGRGGIDRDTDSRLRNAQAIDRQTEALKNQKLTADGLPTNKDGSAAGTFTNTAPMDQAFAALQSTRGGPAFTGDGNVARQQAEANWRWLQTFMQNGGAVSPQAVADAQAMMNATNRFSSGGAAAPIGTGQAPTSVQAASNKTVTINIGNSPPAVIGVNSQADQETLVGTLRKLENAKGASA